MTPEKIKITQSHILEKENDAFSSRLREVIGVKSIRSFANKVSLSEGSLRNMLNGGMPRLDSLLRIAQIGNTNIEWLATGKGNRLTNTHGKHPINEESTGNDTNDLMVNMVKELNRGKSPEQVDQENKQKTINIIEAADGSPQSVKMAMIALTILLESTENLTSEGAQLINDTIKVIQAKKKDK